MKVVNPMPQAGLVNITLAGASTVLDTGTLEVMTGIPGDVNTLHAPQSVSPTTMTVHFPGTHFPARVSALFDQRVATESEIAIVGYLRMAVWSPIGVEDIKGSSLRRKWGR